MNVPHGEGDERCIPYAIGISIFLLLLVLIFGCTHAESGLRSPQYQACLDLRHQIQAEERQLERKHPGSIRVRIAKPHCRENMK